jgi:hypothetical protein
MQAIKDIMRINKPTIIILIFPWLITEIIEILLYLYDPQKEYKPTLQNTFNWIL